MARLRTNRLLISAEKAAGELVMAGSGSTVDI